MSYKAAMIKTLRHHPEILDLWVLPSRTYRRFFKFGLIVAVHVLLFGMIFQIGPKDPYTSYKEIVADSSSNRVEHYDFSRLGTTFLPWQFYRLEEIEASRLEELILSSVPSKKLKMRLANYLQQTLELCEYYQLDPFWVLAVMWTESHFNSKAISHAKANGLMQIMPGTAHFLLAQMNRPVGPKIAYELVKDSKKNIEMGTFYLRRLFINFDFNFKYATIAYNMGPNGVWRRLKRGEKVGRNHLYLKKVRRHYRKLIKPILAHLAKNPAPYTKTFVVDQKWRHLPQEHFLPSFLDKLTLLAHSGNSTQRLEL